MSNKSKIIFGRAYVPVQLLIHSFHHKRLKYLRTYLLLKYTNKNIGWFDLNPNSIKHYSELLKMHSKTFKRHLERLKGYGWINDSFDGKTIHIRGYSKLRIEYDVKSKVELHYDFINKRFEAFCFGAILGYMCNRKKWKEREEKGRKQARIDRLVDKFEILSFPFAISYLAQDLKINKNTVLKYKQYALHHKYIGMVLTPNVEQLHIDKSEFDERTFLNPNPESSLFQFEGKFFKRNPDKFYSILHYKTINF